MNEGAMWRRLKDMPLPPRMPASSRTPRPSKRRTPGTLASEERMFVTTACVHFRADPDVVQVVRGVWDEEIAEEYETDCAHAGTPDPDDPVQSLGDAYRPVPWFDDPSRTMIIYRVFHPTTRADDYREPADALAQRFPELDVQCERLREEW